MRVADLAKELRISSDDILAKLRSLKLKAKDSKQDLSEVVIPILRREFKNVPKSTVKVQAAKEVPSGVAAKAARTATAVHVDDKGKKSPEPGRVLKVETPAKAKTVPKKEESKSAGSKTSKVLRVKEDTKVIKTGKAAKAPGVESKIKPSVTPPIVQKVVPPVVKIEKAAVSLASKPSLKPEAQIKGPVVPAIPAARPAVNISEKKKEDFRKPQLKASTPTVVEVKAPEKPADGTLIAVDIPLPISVKDLSVRIQQKPSVLLKSLMQKGIFANINQYLQEETVRKIAKEFGYEINKLKTQEEQLIESHQSETDDPKLLKSRSPVVTFMGHVDHGKTSLLDKIRKSRVADEEHGGITQHIGAYSVPHKNGRITFLDTPGHEAFTAMRARGANITDLVVLVVAADEGVMPQTEEAMNHAKAAEVPIIVALNKIDKKNADVDRVKKQLMEKGLTPEDWGGKTICVGVSAVTGQGIDQLLEMILLESELLELRANPDRKATGIVVEAHLSGGRGSLATVIVQNGTLHEGDIVITGPYYGRIKAMLDDHERPVQHAGPAMPVEILGLPAVPEAGESFYVVETEKKAKEITEKRAEQIKMHRLEQTAGKLTLEDLYAQIQEGKIKSLSLILKADVQGSLEALKASLEKIPSDQVQFKIIHAGVGDVSTSDVILAVASNAIIIAFQVDINVRAKEEIEKQSVDVRTYRIIYDAVNDITNALEGLLEPKMRKKFLGRVDIRQVFKLSRGIIAGCYVTKGKIHRKVTVDILRNGQVVFTGKLSSLKRFKDDVREVGEGYECGLTIEGYDAVEVGDVVEAYDLEAVARKLVTTTV